MNFKSEKFQNIFIIILLVATILIFSIDFIQTKADTNNSIVLKEKKAILDEEIEKLIEQRTEAKKNKNFQLADEIRQQLLDKGIVLEDTRQGVKWKRA